MRGVVTVAKAISTSADVAVIGAGAAGLVAARELLREGHRVQVFEQASGVGGVWVLDEHVEDDPLGQSADRKLVHSSMYDALRVNLPREIMGFADFPFVPEFMHGLSVDSRRFPGHPEVLRYLKAFALEYDLKPHIRFNTQVTRVHPVASSALSGWEVCTRTAPRGDRVNGGELGAAGGGCSNTEERGREEGSRHFDAVVVCNGHYAVPRVPEIEGMVAFGGKCEHSHNYRRPEPYQGLRVVVIGAHASGEDIARDIASSAREVVMSAKTWMTEDMANERGPFGRQGNMFRRPWPLRLTSDGSVEFEDGSLATDVDVVLFCTGYHYSAPFLQEGLVDTTRSHVRPLFQHLLHPSHVASLSFIGLPFKIVPFPQFELQTKFVARMLSGRCEAPTTEEMERWMSSHYNFFKEAGQPERHIHKQGFAQFEYNDWLASLCGPDVPMTPEWRKALWQDARDGKRKYSPDHYRDQWDNEESIVLAHKAFAEVRGASQQSVELERSIS